MKVQQSIGPNAGFTLVESMLALAIMSVGLLALAGLQITALRGNALSRSITTAVSIAEQRLEQLKNTPYSDIQAEAATQVTASNLHFTRQVTVTNGPLPNTKSVSVLVSWQDQSKTHTLPIATLIGQ
ncbi:MAG TPA: prepilin-type N-terminal cleavage/methylation domain-containing protein [Candidatus Saccharimonadia bacterium]|nr:prepilin-type N-terminal cleavage/methylation domain-containing protein [Candidatus Saccharimonadia bacterium]